MSCFNSVSFLRYFPCFQELEASPVGYCTQTHTGTMQYETSDYSLEGEQGTVTLICLKCCRCEYLPPRYCDKWQWNLGLLPTRSDHNSSDKVSQYNLSVPRKKCDEKKRLRGQEADGTRFITDVHFWDNRQVWFKHLGRILCYRVAVARHEQMVKRSLWMRTLAWVC